MIKYMSKMDNNLNNYQLLDCGDKLKLEKFGSVILQRPCTQAIWRRKNLDIWKNNQPDGIFLREKSELGNWTWSNSKIQNHKFIQNNLIWEIEPNNFGNLGIFVEHWNYSSQLLELFQKDKQVLNLFSYSGSSILQLAKNNYKITSVDSSKSSFELYTRNFENNLIERQGHRLILEDCYKFVAREIRRNAKYSSILVDCPSYGRGTKGELFKIEDDISKLLYNLRELLDKDGVLFLTLHSPRFTPKILEIFVQSIFVDKKVEVSEILVEALSRTQLPSGLLVKVY